MGLPGITPACAGKTDYLACRHRNRKDHPRVCGENNMCTNERKLCKGSPPRVRGKPCWKAQGCTAPRITPACAGKTILAVFPSVAAEDHPRVCGENGKSFFKALLEGGSPPRVRGKRLIAMLTSTPAMDHPRVCGENTLRTNHNLSESGSPPRVRGKQRLGGLREMADRITPACAGKT